MAKDRFLAQGVTRPHKRQRNGKKLAPGGRASTTTTTTTTTRKANGRRSAVDDDSDDNDDQIGDIDNLEHTYGDEAATDQSSEDDDEFLETAADKRLRLAKEYISKVQEATTGGGTDDEYDAAQIDRDLIADRLMTDAQERLGRWNRRIASSLARPIEQLTASAAAEGTPSTRYRVLRNGHRLPVTCVAVTPDGRFVYSGSKDGSLVKWERETGRKLATFRGQKKKQPTPINHALGHCDHILAVAVSSDGKYVATGGRDRRIHVWSVGGDEHLGVFHQHKDAVTGLVFRRGINQLYSCSADRMVKLWNIDEMGYMDTLFGHQDGAVAIDALRREQAVTAGGRDRTLRLWKITEDSQLVFRAGAATDQRKLTKMLKEDEKANHQAGEMAADDGSPAAIAIAKAKALRETNPQAKGDAEEHKDLARRLARDETELHEQCVDVVAMIDEETFVTGGDSGALSLWSTHKKKPSFIHHVAHGVHPDTNSSAADLEDADALDTSARTDPVRPRWITALASVPFTDLFFSASSDGFVRMWQMRPGKATGFDLINVIPVAGYVNGLSVCELSPADALSPNREIVLAAAVGQEPRLGRWAKVKARSVVKVFQFSAKLLSKQ
ncbi:pre-rRNA processing protein [Coemansia sp. RSA 1813]|nr:pre-rRNA processing protein [Coemansia sp. RSA 986]KAJ2214369.1 pre-rRNA processing protein [Coemansia sp. RSA 487]KAJ2567086.1 pre-rRNA processing protein [Coemansia sp. RSA 1813]